MRRLEHTLGDILDQVDQLEVVPKEGLYFGDWIRVTTLDATYSIYVLRTVLMPSRADGLTATICPPLKPRSMGAHGVEVPSRWTSWPLWVYAWSSVIDS